MVVFVQQLLMPAFSQLLGIMLFLAGLLKLADISSTIKAVTAFKIVPTAWAKPTAILVSLSELFLSILLVSGRYSSIALFVAATLFLIFTGVQSAAVVRGLKVACGCFGSAGRDLVGKRTVIRNCLLLVFCYGVGALGIAFGSTFDRIGFSWFAEFLLRAAVTVAVLQYLSIRQMRDNFALEGISLHRAGRVSPAA